MKLRFHYGAGRGWWSSCWPTPSAASSPQCCSTLPITDRSDISTDWHTNTYWLVFYVLFGSFQLTLTHHTLCSVNNSMLCFLGRDPKQVHKEISSGWERLGQRAAQPGGGRAEWGWRGWSIPVSFNQLMSFQAFLSLNNSLSFPFFKCFLYVPVSWLCLLRFIEPTLLFHIFICEYYKELLSWIDELDIFKMSKYCSFYEKKKGLCTWTVCMHATGIFSFVCFCSL